MERVGLIRRNKKITQQQCADALNVGKSQYSHYETGRSQITLDKFLTLISYLDINIHDLFNSKIGISVSKEELEVLRDLVNRLSDQQQT